MNTPPGLLTAGLAFWGWQTHSLTTAALLAIILEGARLVPARWDFSEGDLRRVWNLCTILFVGATIYSFTANDGASGLASLFNGTAARRSDSLNRTSQSVLIMIQWLPMIFAPIALVQAYGSRETMDLRVFSWILRTRALHSSGQFLPTEINVAYPYLLICLLASSTSQNHPTTFFPGLFLLLACAIWSVRNRRFSPASWLGILVVAGGIAFAGQIALNHLQKVLQRLDTAWLSRFSSPDIDALGTRTSLGNLGQLKLSGHIVLRVSPITEPPPALLRQATYDIFDSPWWMASKKKYHPITSEPDENTWRLLANKPTRRAIRVAGYLHGGQGVLSAPTGTAELRELNVFTLKTNELGVIRVDWGPGLVDYVCHYDEGQTIDSLPDDDDLRVPSSEQAAVEQVVRDLNLRKLSPEEVVARVEEYFRQSFEYSTYNSRAERRPTDTPLTRFLTRTHRGHCEYFASATTLILRAAGIPARYAVGYSLTEKKENTYVVRERHAHAWSSVFLNNTWRDVDLTPPSWNPVEAQLASPWEPMADFFSKMWFEFSKWRWSKTSMRPYLILVLIPPLFLIAVRLIFRRRSRQTRRLHSNATGSVSMPGADSEFYLVEKRLAKLGWERDENEPLLRWLQRVSLPAHAEPAQVTELAALHYRYRFDPLGLNSQERETLRQGAQTWLGRPTSRQRQGGKDKTCPG